MLPDDERWRLLDQNLEQLLALESGQRGARLDALAVGDPTLAAELRRLLTALNPSATLDGLSASPLYAEALAELPGIGPGSTLGGWRLLQRVGTGGMSEVYLAEREHNGVRQRAALKLMATGMAAPALRSGFVHECRFLAALSDPRIARYYDSGIAEDGRPWLAMEHVEGSALHDYLGAHPLPLGQRLALFAEIAAALAHAHQRMIVHRDLKPSNVLVADAGQVKLLDFGIARAIDGAPGHEVTALDSRILTLEYASPEQLRGEPVNIASDVYQLGLLLYLVVAGRHPWPAAVGDRLRMMQAILQQAPEPPSRALRAAARAEARAVAGDLDAIVLKALAKSPDDRYASVAALCDDLRAWRQHRPVQARRAGPLRRAGGLIQRHRLVTAVAATALLAGVVFGAAWLDQAMRAANEARNAQAVLDLLRGALHVDGYGVEPQPLETVSALLDAVERRAASSLADQPGALAETLLLVGQARRGRGEYRRAADVLERARAVPRLQDMAPGLYDRIELNLADAQHFSGDYARARELMEVHIARHERSHGADHPGQAGVLTILTDLTHSQGDYAGAQALAERLLRLSRRHFGDADARTAAAHRMLGMVLRDRGRFEQAARHLQQAVRIDRAQLGDGHVNVATDLDHLGLMHLHRGDPGAARVALDEAAAIRTALFQPGLLGRVWSQHRLAQLRVLEGDAAGAIPQLREVIAVYERELRRDSHIAASGHADLGWALLAVGRHEEAADALGHADAMLATLAKGHHPRRADALLGLAVVALQQERPDSARTLAARALALRRAASGDAHPGTAAACLLLREAGGDCTPTGDPAPQALSWRQAQLALARLHTGGATQSSSD